MGPPPRRTSAPVAVGMVPCRSWALTASIIDGLRSRASKSSVVRLNRRRTMNTTPSAPGSGTCRQVQVGCGGRALLAFLVHLGEAGPTSRRDVGRDAGGSGKALRERGRAGGGESSR
jgi:hypothetical protein